MASTPVRNTNDGSQRAPYLRADLTMGNLAELPAWSAGPRGDARAVLIALQAAGFQGVQGGDIALCRELGLGCSTGGRVNRPGEIAPLAAQWKKTGYGCATLHVGWGHESDAEADVLVREINDASRAEDLPIYIETHRATITQDTWRTVQIAKRHPDVRFNADLSHWYTGLEMPYGDIQEKWAFLAPVFERVRFLHGRLGNSGHMQMPLDHPSMPAAIANYREMWTRCMAGFLATAKPGDFISFAPEQLHPAINYAPTARTPRNAWEEGGDRWQDALEMTRIAKECFAEAQKRTSGAAAAR
jgi:hypothetical protein